MYQFYNANPLSRAVGDCTTRALSKVLGITWEEAFVEQFVSGYLMKNMQTANEVWGAVLSKHGFNRSIIPNTCPDCYTVEDFCREHPKGDFVLALESHIIAVVDGDYFDIWDSGKEVPIYYWYRKEE